MQGVTVVDHPLVQHKLTIMRKKEIDGRLPAAAARDLAVARLQVTRNLD